MSALNFNKKSNENSKYFENQKDKKTIKTEKTNNYNTNENNDINKIIDKRLKKTGFIMIGLSVITFIIAMNLTTSKSVDTSEEAKLAITNKMSNILAIGTRIMSDDEYLGGEDLTITHSLPSEETNIYIWDYAAEDGDYVQVIVNGTALGDPFMIKNKPVKLKVPTVGEVQVLGTRDGGGGITYAVHYELNGTTYFNGTTVGDGNLYTLVRE